MPFSKPSPSEPIPLTRLKLALHLTPYVGERTLAYVLRRLVVERMSPSEFLGLNPAVLNSEFSLKTEASEFFAANQVTLLKSADALAQTLRLYHIALLTQGETGYPVRLETNDDAPPPLLYALGDLTTLAPFRRNEPKRFTFTLALSNEPSPEALDRQDSLAQTLADLGGVAVTGHNRPPYQRLALAMQRRNKPSIFVLDRGIRNTMGAKFESSLFPAARIREAEFERERDLVLSPFRPDDDAMPPHSLRRRDHLIFALSDVIVAIDVNPTGGMFSECKTALKAGRKVLVAEGGREGNKKLLGLGGVPFSTEVI